jgi:thioredoxin 1
MKKKNSRSHARAKLNKHTIKSKKATKKQAVPSLKIPLIIISSSIGVLLLYFFFLHPVFSNMNLTLPASNVRSGNTSKGDLSLLNNYPFDLVSNVPTLVDLGRGTCAPCKAMAPILEELRNELKGRANIVYIDLGKFPDAGRDFGIQVIPTVIFYDTRGNEVKRRQGFTSKDDILYELKQVGLKS